MQAVVYVHGFQGSPQSAKARQLGAALARDLPAVRYEVPLLSFEPRAAVRAVERALDALAADGCESPVLVGSSMGGFYAVHVAARRGLRAVLVNPAVSPHELFRDRLGPVENPWTGERHLLCEADLTALQELDVPVPPRPSDLLVLLQTGDETLDWRLAWERYSDCQLVRLHGGNHAFAHFEDCFGLLYRFAGLAPAQA